MEEKEFLKEKDTAPLPEGLSFPQEAGGLKARISGFTGKLFGIFKFLLGVLLLPFVYSSTMAFFNESRALGRIINISFFGGIGGFLIIYLFIYEPAIVYNKGQKILGAVFKFFTPLVRVAPYLLPIYTIILLVIYSLFSWVSKTPEPIRYFVFLFGFTLALHLIFSAKSLRSRKGDFLKANYIFGFSFVYIINLAIMAFGFSLIFDKFSFVNFCNNFLQAGKFIFSVLFKQLFL